MDIKKIRSDCPVHDQYGYLNSAAAAPPPMTVVDTIQGYLTKTATVGPYLPTFRKETYETIDEIRKKAANFIGANEKEIAFVKNGTEGINFVANGLDWRDGDEVIIVDSEFHSNYVPWLRLQNKGKVKLNVIKTDSGGLIDINRISEVITPQTRLISVTHLPNASGALQPVESICKIARDKGVLTLVNASQTLGLIPINVKELDCDFLVACGRKWLRGPEGSGVLYISEGSVNQVEPTLVGWGGTTWNFETNEYIFPQTAKRVEAGCPNVPAILGLGAAIDYAGEVGVNIIYNRVKELTKYTVDQLQKIDGLTIYGPNDVQDRLAIIPFNVEGCSADDITIHLEEQQFIIESGTFMANTMLQQFGISKMARYSPHYFNTHEEIEQSINLIKELIKLESVR